MQVQIKSSNGISLIPIESRLLAERKIFIEGEIQEEMAMEFIKKLMFLHTEDAKKAVDIMINSPGGEFNSGLLMYDCIKTCGMELNMYCMGKAYSMAAVLFAAGEKGHRYMLRNSELMIHEPLVQNRVSGNSTSVKGLSDLLLGAKSKISSILSEHTGKTIEEIDEASGYDHYFTAEEAIQFGLADQMIGFEKCLF